MKLSARWPIRTEPHIGRAAILDATLGVLSELCGAAPGPHVLVKEGEDRGYGYYAAAEWWEAAVGPATLSWHLDPILATMGVSGEFITLSAAGLPAGMALSGRALSSARRPGYLELDITGAAHDVAPRFLQPFGAYGTPSPELQARISLEWVRVDRAYGLLDEAQLRQELAALLALAQAGCDEAIAALDESEQRLATDSRSHIPAVRTWLAAERSAPP